LPVVAFDTGESFEKVIDLVFDRQANNLLALLVDEKGWFSSSNIIPFRDIKSIGPDAIIVPSKEVEINSNQMPEIDEIVDKGDALKGLKLMTTDGRDLGQLVDLYFDEQTGKVDGYEVSGGVFADAYSGRSFVPAYQTLQIGGDVAFVPEEVADMMEEQVGGIKGAVQTASEKVQEGASVAGERLSTAASSASEAVSTRLTQQQKSFVVGKTTQEDVVTDDGRVLFTKGQVVTEADAETADANGALGKLYSAVGGISGALSGAASGLVAGRAIEQARGRRVQRAVRTEEGLIIAAAGQIVTDQVIERSRTYNREQELMDAVGLTAGEAARSSVGGVTGTASTTLREGTARASESASNLWQRAKEKVSELQERTSEQAEEQRIKNALGRPVSRVILDQQDNVILNVGELITHQAVERATRAGVLDILLSSVYDKEPELTTEDLRAPVEGDASLEHQTKTNS
jgi:uncharacterized protein YrrD